MHLVSIKHTQFLKWGLSADATSQACIAVSLSVIRGPLNQQATSVVLNTQIQMQSSVNIPIAQQLPSNYTGITPFNRGFGTATGSLTVPFANVMKQYSTRQGISMPRSGCGDPCLFTVKVIDLAHIYLEVILTVNLLRDLDSCPIALLAPATSA